MRVNVYTEEMLIEPGDAPFAIVSKDYFDPQGRAVRNWGLRIALKSNSDLHHDANDDDRSAVTFWCGSRDGIRAFVEAMMHFETMQR